MPRLAACLCLALPAAVSLAQDPLADLPNLAPNGGFEEGTSGWVVTIGPYGQAEDRWGASKGVAEVIDRDAFEGEHCLRLNAVEQDNEVDVHSERFPVTSGAMYLLTAQVRQLAGDSAYKVVIDWTDADGEHISYDNDWRGSDRPKAYANHGGVFVAPEDAAAATLIIGVQKEAECLFDDVRLIELPGEPGPGVPDGAGSLEAVLPRSIEAGGYGTFRLVYRAPEEGLPIGSKLELRRTNTYLDWSPPQTADPRAPGYTTVVASNGALFLVSAANPEAVPSITGITLEYPPLKAGDTITITYGDTSGGSPGALVQQEAEEGIRFALAVDGDMDGRGLDVGETDGLDTIAGEFAALGLVTPVVAETGRAFTATVEARDRHGNVVPDFGGRFTLDAAGSRRAGEDQFRRDGTGRRPVEMTFNQPGIRTLRAECQGVSVEQELVVTAAPQRPAGPPSTEAEAVQLGDTLVLENEHVRLLLPLNDFGYGVGIVEAHDGADWQRVGAFASMGELWLGESGEEPERVPLWLSDASIREAAIVLTGRVEPGCDAEVTCTLAEGARHIDLACTVTPRTAMPVRAFYAPVFYAGDGGFGASKTSALFPGLEYLTGDEVSSGDYGIVPPHSDRTVPHPYKVTVPLMGVVGDGLGAMLFWDPLQEYDGENRYPAARFGSPERRGDRDGHSLGLFAPSVLNGMPENAPMLEEPVALEPGRSLTLTCSVAGLVDVDDATGLVDYWAAAVGLPEAPVVDGTADEVQTLIARGLLETAWDAEEKGWHNALADPWGAAYNDQIALALHHFALSHPDHELTPRIQAQLAEAGGLRGFHAAFHQGNAADAVEGERSMGMRDVLQMAEDGSYAFHPQMGDKIFSQAQSRSMGDDGEVVVGTCVMGLEPLARRALLTGDPLLVEHLEKGLAFIDRYSRPQGSEHWEVPLACPNLRASALALRCYLYGYQLTGKEDYLERARLWAKTGLPFLYLWRAGDRDVMPYASISVMGTTLHTHTWFGRPVQWVGLVYADAILELAGHDDSLRWAEVADGILRSAMQQQKLDDAECGHVGFYPDAWSMMLGDEAYHWCLAPTLIAQVNSSLRGLDPRASATVLRSGDRTIHIVAPGAIGSPEFDGSTLRFTSSYVAGSTHEVVVAQVSDADEVLVDGEPLLESDITDPATPGWQTTAHGSLRLRIKHAKAAVAVEVRGCRLAEAVRTTFSASVANGDFEANLTHWAPAPARQVSLDADAHAGAKAVALDATGETNEVQCTSGPMRVTGGETYELSAWVKQTAGDGDFKVTVDWLGPDGHLAYANDWAGADRPADYALHGGRFTAPDGAAAVTIILGVRAGTRCLFDDIRLNRVE